MRLTSGTAGYLPQEPDRRPGERLQDYLARRTGVAAAEERMNAEAAALADGGGEDYSDALEAWLALGGADLEVRAETVLRDLGLDVALLELETVALSGGQAARASLAAILLSRFDVLLLDEPTNDLDFDGLAPAGALRRRAARRRRDRLPRPRVPGPDRHARAGDRRDRAHRGRVRRRLGRLPGAAGDGRAPRRGALRQLLGAARQARPAASTASASGPSSASRSPRARTPTRRSCATAPSARRSRPARSRRARRRWSGWRSSTSPGSAGSCS